MQKQATSKSWLTDAELPGRIAIVFAVLAVITGIECHLAAKVVTPVASWVPSFVYGAVFWLWWAGVIYALWRAGKRWPVLLSLRLKNAALQVLLAGAVAYAHIYALQTTVRFVILRWAEARMAGYGALNFFDVWRVRMELLWYLLVWCACAASYAQMLARRSLQLEKELADAQLLALQMQIEPHFLLNTLNSLTALVELDRKTEALKTLERLNTILKMTLKRDAPGKIPLTQELEIVKSYL